MSYQKVIIVGRLGRDPELKTLSEDNSVCNLSVATTHKRKDAEHTEWHRVVVWGKQAESCAKYLEKGRQVCVDGEIRTREWTDKEGAKRYTTEVVANNVRFLGGKTKADASADLPF